MKTHGLNTFAISIRGPQGIATQIHFAIEERMLDNQVPIFLMHRVGPEVFNQLVPNWDEVVKKDTNPPPVGQRVSKSARLR